jgi:DNA-directed RNA polymerase subunit beta'
VSEVAGFVRFVDFVDGVTVHRASRRADRPASVVIDRSEAPRHGRQGPASDRRSWTRRARDLIFRAPIIPAHYLLPPRAIVNLQDGAQVGVGDVVARIPQEASKTRDITGGLPRVADLFEARKPKDRPSWPRSRASSASARTPRASSA